MQTISLEPTIQNRLAGWAAYVSGVLAIIALVAIAIFFAGIAVFGPINDIALGLMALCMLPIAFSLHHTQKTHAPRLSRFAFAVGIVGMLAFVVHQLLLVLGVLTIKNYQRIEESPLAVSTTAFGLIGLWLIVTNYLAYRRGQFSRGLAGVGVLSGVGFVVMCESYWLGGLSNPLTVLGGLVWQIVYPVWSIWLGRALMKTRAERQRQMVSTEMAR